MKSSKQRLQEIYDKYFAFVCWIARVEFNRVVRPYCIKHKLDFRAGNGAFVLWKHDVSPNWGGVGQIDTDSDRFPKKVRDVLQMEIPGMPGNDLGSLMPDYDYKEGD